MQSTKSNRLFQVYSRTIYGCICLTEGNFTEPKLYLLSVNQDLILIGNPESYDSSVLFLEIRKMFPGHTLRYIILPNGSNHFHRLQKDIRPFAPDAVFILDQKEILYLNQPKNSQKIQTIQELKYHLLLSNQETLHFISSPYLIHAGSFFVYYETERTLFSNYLFANPLNSLQEPLDSQISHSLPFLLDFLPSSEFLRSILSQIERIQVDRVLTVFGNDFTASEITLFKNTYHKLDFYKVRDLKQQEQDDLFDPYPYLDQLVRKLIALFGKDTIQQTFADSPFRFDPLQESLESTTLSKMQAWNRFFDFVYAKGGLEYLGVLEPTVDKISQLYQLKKPVIFASTIVDTSKQLEEVETKRQELTSQVKQLQAEMENTINRLIKDPLTDLFNAAFLEANLMERFTQTPKEELSQTQIFYIAVDHMHRINRKYSYQIGDETIRHFASLVQSFLHEEDQLYRASGISLALVASRKVDANELETMLANIRESTIFIQPITASIASVRFDEIPEDYSPQAKAKTLLATAENRIQSAFQRGGNTIITQNTILVKPKRGKILIVDEDPMDAQYFRTSLENESFDVDWSSDGLDALRRLENTYYHAILCDKYVPKLDGFQLKNQLNKSIHQDICFLLLVQAKTPDIIARANRLQITAVLERPVFVDEIVGFIQRNQGRRGSV